MARDIEEFLKRAAERRQQQKGGGAPPPPQPQAPPPQQQQQQQQQQRAREAPVQQTPIQRERSYEPEIVEDVEVVSKKQSPKSKSQRESVSEYVQRHLDTSQIAEKAKSLGSQVAQVGQTFDQQVHEHLNHEIGSVNNLRVSEVGQKGAPAGPSMVSRVREMLSKPQTAAEAILISEILRRPNFDDE